MKKVKGNGFTLLEVMIALAIFSIGSVALTKGMSQLVGQQSRLELKTFASWIAENKYNQRVALQNFPEVGVNSDEIQFAGQNWEVEEQIIATPNPFMRRIEISVFLLRDNNLSAQSMHSVTGFIGDLQN